MEVLSENPSRRELTDRLQTLRTEYETYRQRGLSLDMSRGKPCPEQLDLTLSMLTCVSEAEGYRAEDGTDTRNYGLLDGIPEARRLFASILEVEPDQVIVCGNSSLNIMFDYIATAYAKGVCGNAPWAAQGAVKFLCPVPGYDRHFSITEFFGIDMLPIPMTEEGPDMDRVEEAVKDPLVKGIWCVPMYSNPDGITYSDETVRRFAALRPAAPDFRIMWDNAYCLHPVYEEAQDHLLNLYEEAVKQGTEDQVILFTSTSKISFPGSGVSAVAASPANVADIKKRMTVQTIGCDKLNMLRHVRFFKDVDGIKAHMKRHAAILRPKFDIVLTALKQHFEKTDIARWHSPKGGYFVSVTLAKGCAKRTVALLKEAGVTITGAGATYPYRNDPEDATLRLAPSYPSQEELKLAMELFCLCAEMAYCERRLEEI